MRNLLVAVAIVFCFGLALVGCSTDNPTGSSVDVISVEKKPVDPPVTGEGSFGLIAKYTYVRSYPGGGGVFILRLVPGADLTGDVALTISSDKMLGAQLTTTVVNAGSTIAEVTISPTTQVALTIHSITVTATNQTHQKTVVLEAEVFNWGVANMGIAQEKQSQFVDWLAAEHPELGNFTNQHWDVYGTYPQILIVEHYTFLSDKWEFRVCFHVMIPPYDWSKMLLRRRGEWEPVLAAIREWDETAQDYVIHEMPIKDYPVIYGY